MAPVQAARRTILPASSTPLERAMDTTFPRDWGTLADLAEPGATGSNAELLPWLAQQWQVAQFAPYFDSLQALMAQAVPWLMERGSAAAVRRALGWLGYTLVTIDEDGAWLHIDAGQPLTAPELARVVHVVRASLPAHVNFWRVFHGYDVRPIVLDVGPALDTGMLDGYSGTVGESGLVESYGARAGGTLAAYPVGQPTGATTQVRVSVSRYDDMPVLDAWRLDSRVLAGVSGGVMELTTFTSNAPTPGGGSQAQTTARVSDSPWIAPAPVGAMQSTTFAQAAVPVHPHRRWGGAWAGRWREHFQLISTEET